MAELATLDRDQSEPIDGQELARDSRDEGKEDKDKGKDKITAEDKRGLSPQEVKDLESGHTTINKLATQKKQLEKNGQDALKAVVKNNKDIRIDEKEQIDLLNRIKDTKSPEKLEELIKEIEGLPAKKAQEAKNNKEEEKILDMNHPEIQKELKDVQDLLEDKDTITYLGKKQANTDSKGEDSFYQWYKGELAKQPSIAKAKSLKNELKEHSSNGIKPRKEFYLSEISPRLKQYGVALNEAKYLAEEGKSERESFIKTIKNLEEFFRNRKDMGFYSKEFANKTIGEALKSEKPEDLKNLDNRLKKIGSKESTGFLKLNNSTIEVGGRSIQKVSKRSKQHLLDYYKNASLDERESMDWEKIVENEGELAKDLEKIYKDHPDLLKLALGSFESQDFMEKKDSLEKHKKIVESSEQKEEKERELIIDAATAKINDAAENNIIAPGEDKTQGRYIKFFEDPKNFKNQITGEKGDVKEMKKAYDILVSTSPDEKNKNLAAYATRHEKFHKDLDKLEELHPEMTEEELEKWRDQFDNEGWSRREKVQEDLSKKLGEKKAEQSKQKAVEAKSGVKDSDETKDSAEYTKDKILTPDQIKDASEAYLENKQYGEGFDLISKQIMLDPKLAKNEDVKALLNVFLDLIGIFGRGEQVEEKMEDQMLKTMEDVVDENEELTQKMDEEQIVELRLQGAEQSELRHAGVDHKQDAQERAEKESMEGVAAGSLEAELIEEAYDKMGEGSDEKFVLDKTGTGKKVDTTDYNLEKKFERPEDLVKAKQEMFKEQNKLDLKQGLDTEFKDEKGDLIEAKKVRETLQKEDHEELAEKIQDKATEKLKATNQIGRKAVGLFNPHEQAAALKKQRELAQQVIDERTKQKLKQAA